MKMLSMKYPLVAARVTPTEAACLKRYTKLTGLTVSTVVRTALRCAMLAAVLADGYGVKFRGAAVVRATARRQRRRRRKAKP